MFCPNCGTKNDASVVKCVQCGFELKAKASVAKFKGTVMMKGGPGALPGTPGSGVASAQAASKKPAPNLKGTMVGVAPPGLDEVRKQATTSASASPAVRTAQPNLKGTMVGVAPPDVRNLRNQSAQAPSAKSDVSSAGSSAASAKPNSKLKGTMIGLAPPDMQAQVKAAKAKIAAKKAEKTEGEKTPPVAAAQPSADANPSTEPNPPSKLKGTMIGVAPPDMQAQVEAAKAKMLAQKAAAAQKSSPTEEAKTAANSAASKTSMASNEAPGNDDPPSEPDPLGGTMVGTSPFAPKAASSSTPPPASASESSGGTPTADFDDQTPAASSEEQEAARTSSSAMDSYPHIDEPVPGVPPGMLKSPISSKAAPLPGKKSSAGPLLFLVVLISLVIGVVVALVTKGGDEPREDASEEKTAEEAENPDEPTKE